VSPDLKNKQKRGRPPKKRKIGELEVDDDELGYDDSEGYSLRRSTVLNSSSKRVRPAWSVEENRTLLRILEQGIMDPQAIFEEMNKDPNNRKTADHIRNRRSTLNTRALARAVELLDVLRDEIAKQEAGIDEDAVYEGIGDGDIPPPIATTYGVGGIPPPIAASLSAGGAGVGGVGGATGRGKRAGRPTKKGGSYAMRDEDLYGEALPREPKARRLSVRTTPAGPSAASFAALRTQVARLEIDSNYIRRALDRIQRQNSKILSKLGIEDEPELEDVGLGGGGGAALQHQHHHHQDVNMAGSSSAITPGGVDDVGGGGGAGGGDDRQQHEQQHDGGEGEGEDAGDAVEEITDDEADKTTNA
jgi:hypothetical protein